MSKLPKKTPFKKLTNDGIKCEASLVLIQRFCYTVGPVIFSAIDVVKETALAQNRLRAPSG